MADVEQRALAERPDYRAAQQSLRLAEANVKLAEAYGTTDPTLGGEYDRSGNDNSGGFQVSIPLRIFDRNQGEKERTRYEAQSSRFAEMAARNQVINDVDQAWAAYQTALHSRGVTTATILHKLHVFATTWSSATAMEAALCSTTSTLFAITVKPILTP